MIRPDATAFGPGSGDSPAGDGGRVRLCHAGAGPRETCRRVSVGGRTYRHVRTVKHDFFAATGFYDAPDGERVVLKVGRVNGVLGLPGGCSGRWAAARETRFHATLADVPGVPAVLGRVGATGFVHAFVPGRPLGERGPDGRPLPVPDAFFDDLAALLAEVHRRRVAYVDANKPQNILVGDDGRPHLIDFQISYDLHELGDTRAEPVGAGPAPAGGPVPPAQAQAAAPARPADAGRGGGRPAEELGHPPAPGGVRAVLQGPPRDHAAAPGRRAAAARGEQVTAGSVAGTDAGRGRGGPSGGDEGRPGGVRRAPGRDRPTLAVPRRGGTGDFPARAGDPMIWLGYLLVLVASSLNAVQTGCNAKLQRGLAQPLLAAAVVYAVGLAVLLTALAVGVAVRGTAWVSPGGLARVPWWALAGGVLGSTYILAMVTMADRVGSAAFMALSFAATIATAVLIDHYGWLGMRHHPAGLWRVVGCALMAGGVVLVACS